jgi:hypothetical protein
VDERHRLDVQRATGPVEQHPAGQIPAASAPMAVKNSKAAGYIVVPSGVQSTWSDGDFRVSDRSSSTRSVTFPGSVAIAVHGASTSPAKDAADTVQEEETQVGTTPSDDSEQADDLSRP